MGWFWKGSFLAVVGALGFGAYRACDTINDRTSDMPVGTPIEERLGTAGARMGGNVLKGATRDVTPENTGKAAEAVTDAVIDHGSAAVGGVKRSVEKRLGGSDASEIAEKLKGVLGGKSKPDDPFITPAEIQPPPASPAPPPVVVRQIEAAPANVPKAETPDLQAAIKAAQAQPTEKCRFGIRMLSYKYPDEDLNDVKLCP